MRLCLSRYGLLCLLVSVPSGCGGSSEPADRPQRVSVTGTVLYQERPVEGATVVFIPQGGNHGAVGVTDASGRFMLTTFDRDDGAVPGDYSVTVRKVEMPPAVQGATDDAPPPAGDPKPLLPDKYASAATSGLQAKVAEGQPNHFEFELQAGVTGQANAGAGASRASSE